MHRVLCCRARRLAAQAVRGLWLCGIVTLASAMPAAVAEDAWYPSRYGASDTIGAANHLSPDIVRDAAKLITTGKVYSLAIDSSPRTTRSFQLVVVPRSGSGKVGTNDSTGLDDLVCAWQGDGTHIHGLAHHGINFVLYNGIRAEEIYRVDGLRKLGIHAVPPIVSRGVLLDMARYYGVDAVKPGTVFEPADLRQAATRQHVEIRAGDVVLLHTGWISLFEADPKRPPDGMPGPGKEAARYLAGLGVVAIGTDASLLEPVPPEQEGEQAPVHQILLARHGVYILENVDTRALAADSAYEFLFVLGQPRLAGAVQAMVNPIAIR